MKVILEIALIAPLVGALICSTLSSRFASQIAKGLSLIPLAASVWFWLHTDPNTVLATPLTEGMWLPSVPVDFSLAISGLALPFWILGQAVACVAIWQNAQLRSWACVPALLFAQFCLTVVFAAQDLILFAAAAQAFWLATLFNAQTKENATPSQALAFILGAGCLLLTSAAILGGLHQEQFQIFSTRLSALRELNLSTETVWGEFTLAEILFGMMALATTLMAPSVPAHGWLQALLRGKSRASQVLVVGAAPALAVFTWVQWIVPVFPEAYSTAAPWLLAGLTGAALYSAALAFAAEDLFEWLAGAALMQTAFALLGVNLGNADSAAGAALHGVLWPTVGMGLACLFGWLEDAFGSRRAEDIGNLSTEAPRIAVLIGLFALIAIAAPTSGLFASVILVLSGLLQTHPLLGIVLCLAWVLWVCSTFRIVRSFFFGACLHKGIRDVPDLRWRRVGAAAVLVLFSLWVGFQPQWLRAKTDPALKSYWKVPLKALRTTAPGGNS